MKLINLTFLLLVFQLILGSVPLKANTKGQEVLDTGTVKQQIDFVVRKASTYNQYKVIKSEWVSKLTGNILDSLDKAKQQLVYSQREVSKKQKNIEDLTKKLQNTQLQLTDITKEKNSIKVFGMLISKASYTAIMFAIIISLIVLISILFVAFKRSNIITTKTREELSELREEFDTHRKRAREREEKMARRHLDEILKYKNQSFSGKS